MKPEIKDAIAKLAEVTLAGPQGGINFIVRSGVSGNSIDLEFGTSNYLPTGLGIAVNGSFREYPKTVAEAVERFATLVDEAT